MSVQLLIAAVVIFTTFWGFYPFKKTAERVLLAVLIVFHLICILGDWS
jgi:peroxiredoxin family protein